MRPASVSSTLSPAASRASKCSGRICLRLMSVSASRSARQGRNSSIRSSASDGPSGAQDVQEPELRVQPDALAGGGAVGGQQGVQERQQRVHPVARRAARPQAEGEIVRAGR